MRGLLSSAAVADYRLPGDGAADQKPHAVDPAVWIDADALCPGKAPVPPMICFSKLRVMVLILQMSYSKPMVRPIQSKGPKSA